MPRLDALLLLRGFTESRSRAKELILSGAVSVNGKICTKPAFSVSENDMLSVEDSSVSRFVSRGGIKLDAALQHFGLSPRGCVCLDIGASTGGFTDCLLQNGARLVYAVDAGRMQLHATLRSDARVISMENQNARLLTPEMFQETPHFAVMDVSFISQTLLHPVLSKLLPEGSPLVVLIKPQFELSRAALSKNGIVRSERDRKAAVERVESSLSACGFQKIGILPSPITGGSGNSEFLGAFIRVS